MNQVRHTDIADVQRAGAVGPVPPPPAVAPADTLIEMSGVTVEFSHGRERFKALDDVNLTIRRGEHVAIVGESGSGKSTLGRVMVGLQRFNGAFAAQVGGNRAEVVVRRRFGRETDIRRGAPSGVSIQMVFQSSEASLDPRWTARACVAEATARGSRPNKEQLREAERFLDLVGIPARRHSAKASELSGGQRQRVAIARALALGPDLLVCDEATSALDVATRAGIIDLLLGLQRDLGVTLCVITHDLSTARVLCARCVVMNKGRIVEEGPTTEIIEKPQVEYTQQLLAAVPRLQVDGPAPVDSPRMSRLTPGGDPTSAS